MKILDCGSQELASIDDIVMMTKTTAVPTETLCFLSLSFWPIEASTVKQFTPSVKKTSMQKKQFDVVKI